MVNPNKNTRGAAKIILSIFCLLILCLIIGIAALPSIVSTQWGNEKIAQLINSQIAGKVAFQKLHVSWFGGQKIEKAQLFDAEGKQIASLDSADTAISLWKLLFNANKCGAFSLSGLNALIVKTVDGKTNIQLALASSDQNVAVVDSKQAPLVISLQDVNASAVLDKEKNSQLQLSGKSSRVACRARLI